MEKYDCPLCNKKFCADTEEKVFDDYKKHFEGEHKKKEKTKIAQQIEKLFVNRNDVYAQAFLDIKNKRMGYKRKIGLIDNTLIQEHLEQNLTLGVYQLKGTKVKWGCADFDLNTEKDFDNAKKLYNTSKKEGYNPLIEMSGGGEFKCHIWFFSEAEASDMKYFIEDLCEKTKVQPHEIFPKQTNIKKEDYGNLVKLPLGLHLLSKKNSIILDDNFVEITNEQELIKKLQHHIDNPDNIPKIIIKAKPQTQLMQQDKKPSEFDKFFNYVLTTELPKGISKSGKYQKIKGINDNILKNLAIWFHKKEYTLEQLKEEIKPLYDERGWSFGDLKGWFRKAEKGDITEISTGELAEWCKTYLPTTIKLLPQQQKEELEIYSDEELITRDFPEPRWIIKNQIPEGEIGIMAGKRGERKTFMALYQAICVSSGLTCAEDEVKEKKRVFYISEEDSIRALLPRIKAIKKGLGIEKKKLEIKYFVQNNLKLDATNDKTSLFHMEVKEFKPDLIIVDTFQRCVSFDVDVDNRAISEFFTGTIRPITKALGCSWLFIHHLRKGLSGVKKADDLMDEIRGGSEIVNYPRFVLICQVPRQSKDMMVLTPVKMSHAELSEPKVLSFINSEEEKMITISYMGLPAEVLKMEIKCAEAIKDYLFKQQITEFRTKDMIEKEQEIGYKRSMITGGLKVLVEQDYLVKPKRGYYKIKGGGQSQL